MRYDRVINRSRELFMAVCDDLGAYFSEQGFRYARSSPKLTKKIDSVQLQMGFWSSHSNTAGHWVHFEIAPYIYVKDKALAFPDRRNMDIISYAALKENEKADLITFQHRRNLCLMDDDEFELLKASIQEKIIEPAERLAKSDLLLRRADAFRSGADSFSGKDMQYGLQLESKRSADGILSTVLDPVYLDL